MLGRSRSAGIALALVTAALFVASGTRAQVQTPDQRACTSAMHGALGRVAAAAARGVDGCVRAASRAELPAGTDVEACAAADEKLAKAAARTAATFDGKCAGEGKRPPGSPRRPPYGVAEAAAASASGTALAADLAHDLLGEDLDLAILAESGGKDAARCQQLAAREASACAAARLREYGRCVRAGLKSATAPFDSAVDLAACFGADPKGAVAKRCEATTAARLGKRCTAKGVDLAQALPACGAADAAAAVACTSRAAACRACRAAREAGDLAIDCDAADDGAANGSCAEPIGTLACPLDPESSFFLESDGIFFGDVLSGALEIACGAPDATGTAPCACEIDAIAPVETAGGFWACVSPVAGCAAGTLACDGGPSQDARIDADHDIGACSGSADCAAQCATHCSAAGTAVWGSGCEGYCAGGSADGAACTTDSQCPGGACTGAPSHGNVCQCQCLDHGGAPSRPGGLRCELGARIRIEAALPCDGADVLSDTGDRCLPLTTETAQATLTDRDHEAGETLPGGVDLFEGAPVSCDALRAGGSEGMLLVSAANAFDVALAGDVYLVFALECAAP